jgi:exosortase
LPNRVEFMLAHPLQRVATIASTYALQTLGVSAFSEGNVIRMGQIPLNVAEACSGLSMLMIFFALTTAVLILYQRPWLDRVLILLSAAPIALIANISRITVTGLAHKLVGPELADLVFHGLAGWLMMVLALGLLWVEFRVLAWVFETVEESEPLPMMPGGQPVPVGVQASLPPVSPRGYLKPKASALPRLKKGQ